METRQFDIIGMTCASCQNAVERAAGSLDGVNQAEVSLLSNSMRVTFDPQKTDPQKIAQAVDAAGYQAVLKGETLQENSLEDEWKTRREKTEKEQKEKFRTVISSLILLALLYCVSMLPMLGIFSFWMSMEWMMVSTLIQIVLTLAILFIQRSFFTRGIRALFHKNPNMDSLVAIGSLSALLYGFYAAFMMAHGYGMVAEGLHEGHMLVHEAMDSLYLESAATIVTLVSLGKYLEARSKVKTSQALEKLVDLAPKSALIERNGLQMEVSSSEVLPGDTVIIKPGKMIPVDGIVLDGTGFVDQAALTGESIPVEKNAGDEVMSATMNINGSFRFTATHVGNDTTLAKIIRLVEEAGNTKAPIARLADRVSGIFVPIVIGLALLTLVGWLVAGQTFSFALSNAICVLVISCPCALGLATPLAIMVSTGKAAEYGILIKNATALETLKSIGVVVLDKTGTITSGKPSVQEILVFDGRKPEAFLELAAGVEEGSEHPLARAILAKAKDDGIQPLPVLSFEAVSGKGIQARIGEGAVTAGNLTFMQEEGIDITLEEKKEIDRQAGLGRTPLLFALNGKLIGLISVADSIRPDSRQALKDLHQLGIETVMLTGDNSITARAIASTLDIDHVISDVLPADKEAKVRAFQDEGKIVAMVGDGINDAPALMRADVGIAIGAGTDIAIESADVVLMKDSLMDVVLAVNLSKKTISNIQENLFWAFFYNCLFIPVAMGLLYPLFGWLLSPMMAALAMSLSSVTVCLNALRLRFFRPKVLVQTVSPEDISKEEIHIEEAIPDLVREEREQSRDSVIIPVPKNVDTTGMLEEVKSIPFVLSAQMEEDGSSLFVLFSAERDAASIEQEVKNCFASHQLPAQENHDILLHVEGMTCDHCKGRVQKALESIPGVQSAEVSLENKEALVHMNLPVLTEDLIDSVEKAGYDAYVKEKGEPKMETVTIAVEGMSCDHCSNRVKKALEEIDGVENALVSLENANAELALSKPVEREVLVEAVKNAGYEAK